MCCTSQPTACVLCRARIFRNKQIATFTADDLCMLGRCGVQKVDAVPEQDLRLPKKGVGMYGTCEGAREIEGLGRRRVLSLNKS